MLVRNAGGVGVLFGCCCYAVWYMQIKAQHHLLCIQAWPTEKQDSMVFVGMHFTCEGAIPLSCIPFWHERVHRSCNFIADANTVQVIHLVLAGMQVPHKVRLHQQCQHCTNSHCTVHTIIPGCYAFAPWRAAINRVNVNATRAIQLALAGIHLCSVDAFLA